uniref:CCHC-type domain-containing protein n=1 Tax=Ananas comosus var. bracteatus TaxID=296719 RepID=A0A6V7NLP6_ANACO|nr:unnamed protein product [Ananas comosus var. bracteatus]
MLRRGEDRKKKKAVKRVVWADEVGRKLLVSKDGINGEVKTLPEVRCPKVRDEVRDAREGITADQLRGNGVGKEDPPGDPWTRCERRKVGGRFNSVFTEARSYKEALLRGSGPQAPTSLHLLRGSRTQASNPPSRTQHFSTFGRTRSNTSRMSGKCFRCLAPDHWVVDCRDPIKCIRCLRSGHRASTCKEKAGVARDKMHRMLQRRERTPRVYVPYTEEFLRRREQRRNAVLADVIQPANLGPDPTSTIANALARRFGGYSQDFPVARFRERDFAIFLPEWVSAEVIARREILTLEGFWLRCFAWGPYRDARPHRMAYRAWIRLVNLPFECWTVPRVAALVCGFGRFVKADEVTKAMSDLRAFRCQIILDTLTDIPQNLAIILGEERFPVMVHLESWERAVDEAHGDPPGPPRGGMAMITNRERGIGQPTRSITTKRWTRKKQARMKARSTRSDQSLRQAVDQQEDLENRRRSALD